MWEMKTYIAFDAYDSALQFTGDGRSVQCDIAQADVFTTKKEALDALKTAQEKDGRVEAVEVHGMN